MSLRPASPLSSALVCAAILAASAATAEKGMTGNPFTIAEDEQQIRIASPTLEATIRKRGYVSGVAGGSFLDRKTGFRDVGFGLDIVDWLMEPGSDEAYRDRLQGDLKYEFNNLYHGSRPKRSIEGPQICTKAREVDPVVVRGRDFTAVRMQYRYHLAAPGKKTGSLWEQTLVFPAGKRYFLSSDRITTANDGKGLFLRIDMPGHIKHQRGDTFSEVYLSYAGRIPSSEFLADFGPDEKNLYVRGENAVPKRFIRAYRLRDSKTGAAGPWLAGMTLEPSIVTEAWCHQRGYVCMIQEFGTRPRRPEIRAGESFSAAFIVGFFDSIEEMHRVYDEHAGSVDLSVDEKGWKLLRSTARPRAAADDAAPPSPVPARSPAQLLAERLEWFQDQKFGLFVHWGPYSQWGCIESWPLVEADRWARPDGLKAWEERGRDMERFKRDYWALNRTFNPRSFEPRQWAEAAKQAGMRYFVFTTKHHDGFSMWDTRWTDYRVTAPDCPYSRSPRPDVVRELFDTFRAAGFGIGAYFSKADWHHPDYWSPDAPATTRNPNYDTLTHPEKWDRFRRFVHGQVGELVSGYGPIDILWLDAGQVRPPRQDLRMDELAAMARRHQPGLILVDRTVGGEHENYRTPEQEVPDRPLPHVWESCITMGDQWSYRPDDRYKSPRQLIHLLVDVVAKGGNLLLNVGPQPDGRFPAEALSRLREIGTWMEVNGEAIHGTRPMAPYKEGRVALTRRGSTVYAIYLTPEGEETLPDRLQLPVPPPRSGGAVRLLGTRRNLEYTHRDGRLTVEIPSALARRTSGGYAPVIRIDAEPG